MSEQRRVFVDEPRQIQAGRIRPSNRVRGKSVKSVMPTRAAQYLRMSTENQRYSIVNQAKAIEEYAAAHGYQLVVSYADPGKSGLSLKNRPGLQQLLSDAINPARPFDAVLVLDVSRWGRFQDPDQAAHYEFICRQAGLAITYCAEPFQDDDSSMSILVKDLKRVMASEYSRELSDKMHRAKMHLARLGFKQGGPNLPYGFQRLLVDEKRRPRFVLTSRQRKSLKTDRIVIVPGPRQEQKVIARIFDLFVDHKLSINRIARLLNAESIPASENKPWSHSKVATVLKSELCIGRYVFNRTRKILQGPEMRNPEEEWVRVQIMKPIISQHLFWKAQAGLNSHRWEIMPAEQILDGLRRLLREKGRLSRSLIKNSKYLPHPNTLALRFGGLSQAFAAIGYERPKTVFHPNRARHLMDEDIFAGLRRLHQQHGYVTRRKINQDRTLPCAASIKQRFGSIYRAYALSGLPPVTHSHVTTAARARRKLREDAILKSGRKLKTVYTTEELIVGLQRILKKHGYISARLIDQDPCMPTAQTVGVRFGSHRKAYKLAGWSRTHRQIALAALKSRYQDPNVVDVDIVLQAETRYRGC
jgi:DNA invertase Pin-like site-specific DNA recombinase